MPQHGRQQVSWLAGRSWKPCIDVSNVCSPHSRKSVRAARQLERLLERRELVAHQLDASAERALEELRVGGRNRVPFESVQVGSKVPGRIELGDLAEAMGFWVQDSRPELQLPKNAQCASLVVVVEANEIDAGLLAVLAGRGDLLHEVLPLAHLDDVALFGHEGVCALSLQRLGDSLAVGAVGLEDAAREERSGSTIVREAVSAAGRPKQ